MCGVSLWSAGPGGHQTDGSTPDITEVNLLHRNNHKPKKSSKLSRKQQQV